MIKFIQNTGDFFAANYFDEDFTKKVLDKTGYAPEDIKEFIKRITALKDRYFKFKQAYLEENWRTKDKITETHRFHSEVLNALGYPGNQPEYQELFHVDEKTVLPIRHTLYRGDKPFLMIMEMRALIKEGEEDPDGLFEQRYHFDEESNPNPPQKYHRSQWGNVFQVPDGLTISPMIINKALSELFLLDQHRRPKYILLCAGNTYFLLEQEKWFRGSYLSFDLEELFSEGSVKREYYALFYFLLAREALAPQSEIVLMDQLEEDSHKSAYEVTQDLKEGVIHAVEALANEAVFFLKNQENRPLRFSEERSYEKSSVLTENDIENVDNEELKIENGLRIEADTLKNECLNYVYRLLFLFYAESRNDLDILPADDAVYQHGYSLEMLRDLEQVPLNTASSQNGYFFHESLSSLFHLLGTGYKEKADETRNKSFRVRHLDSPLFDDGKLEILPKVKIRNVIWQDVICQLSLSRKQRGKTRGRISYANLGINQLGSVYESLLAFRGFFAETDNIEVHRKLKAKETSEKVARTEGSYLVPRHRIDDFDPDEIYRDKDEKVKIIPQGTFIYRLSGRDRQKSASYYTPEVLTECTVKYTLKPILERLDKGEMKALDLLDLKILEPAMGAAAFHNEVINQLSEAYLSYRQEELKKKVAPDKYREELQKIKAYIALNNVYGVDLNPTAVELGKLSLWLNVIHQDMQTPFFGYRLGVGNAVVGAWLKVYTKTEIIAEYPSQSSKKSLPKEWWEKAPKHISMGKRKPDDIYHFLLPDKNMVPSAGIKLLKEAHAAEAKAVSEWKKEFCKPIDADEYQQLQLISKGIDLLLEEHYKFQASINIETKVRDTFFGAYGEGDQVAMTAKSYSEKEKLAKKRGETNAPYYKLKMIMDYWCSLWFWDMRQASQLPTRREWLTDIEAILHMDLDNLEAKVQEAGGFIIPPKPVQSNLFAAPEPQQLTLKTYNKNKGETLKRLSQKMDKERISLFTNSRSQIVQKLAEQFRFFHYQLEFIEVFKERGGFDVAVGNPPWLKLTFEEKGLMSETFPELVIRKVSAPKVRKLQEAFLEEEPQREAYFEEYIGTEAAAVFMNAGQNYPLLKGQQTNLYKCVLENGLHWVSDRGFLGLLHPEGIYDDPNGHSLRREIYPRLKYHFQFKNELMLFSEIDHHNSYGTHIYSGKKATPSFQSINNLFHPSTIYGCFLHDGSGTAGGHKVKDETTGKMIWNIKPHASRIVNFTLKELKTLARTFEGSDDWESTKLVSIHAKEIMAVLEKLGEFGNKTENFETKITVCWDETNDLNAGNISRNTKYPNLEEYEMIYSGPHFFVSNPLYKTPREECVLNSHYDVVELAEVEDSYIARTNYIPQNVTAGYGNTIKAFEIGVNADGSPRYDNWLDYYKIGFRKMLSQAGERTLNGAIIPPKTTHIYGLISVTFKSEIELIEFAGITSSVVLDFFIKTVGTSNLTDSRIKAFPLGIADKFKSGLFSRTLLLNCLNKYYAPLWGRHYQEDFREDTWTKEDVRIKPFASLTPDWNWHTPLRNWFERRQALVEIDVITAMTLGLTLEELILIYNVQFPVLQQNEDDTWYDQRGNIVFTCSKGLTGVGLDRAEWNEIKDMKAGETYEHTITKSELYLGKKVTYYAPFDKCDRVEDYKQAWEVFEGRLGI
ncbi:Eco57I restriction-modification methylase domain-containing protein [Cyclobacterium jeungdonense]|uniref:site-specific DNA-methyltransferase (adenine-specific) n=1 Tax=Cyclobacterium jeungdonense TaxID=708087 RepID=A0ABT8C625_9BACT|nr:hypothetical protein [Cyclobacterium jeungdonense]MDN3688239.1 hypothetical protein [Cyclobacterium jeungdonense]